MTLSLAEKRLSFRALHQEGCFVLPNPWDVGSARMFQHLGFAALASTSSGYAWTTGRPDYAVTRDDVLAHLAALSSAVDLPINADFESGFAADPEGVAASVRLAIGTGIAGFSIEDRNLEESGLYGKSMAVERVRAARAAIDQSGEDVILVARTEGLLIDPSALTPAIDKLVAFAEAGADCLYAPGVAGKDAIAAMVRAVAPKPLNVLIMDPATTVAEMADLGVRRLSVGGALARVAWAATVASAKAIKEGSFSALAGGMSGRDLNGIFGQFE
ncbi:MAG TPA: isocitrate lyase/phosphoenolpyruvate mutase family protein [Stellaceae bacterium]|nr:isocitrate lyase/phosphoenolpyruvate mutase family protein [Stellaceae bacterium]